MESFLCAVNGGKVNVVDGKLCLSVKRVRTSMLDFRYHSPVDTRETLGPSEGSLLEMSYDGNRHDEV